MLEYWSLHNIRNLEISISGGKKLFELLEGNNFNQIRPHIIINFDYDDKIDLCYTDSSDDYRYNQRNNCNDCGCESRNYSKAKYATEVFYYNI